jgi:dTDP-3-amino-3,4,6-trideoxy-alpha-D-glucose transaminase
VASIIDVPFLDARREAEELGGSLTAAIARVIESGRYVLGAEVEALEAEFATYCGRRHCVGVGNGLDALRLVLTASGIGQGDEVLVPAYTAVATWMAVSLAGATPIGVDVDPGTFNVDPSRLEAAITSRTRAVIPVDLFGQPADLEAVADVAKRHDLLVIEDAAQAVGARSHGRSIGARALACTFSFYPTKNLAAIGDGGAVVTDDDDLADEVRLLRSYGWRTRGVSERVGGNSRLDELQAAVLRLKLEHLDRWTTRRREIARRYLDVLGPLEIVRVPQVPEWAEPVWHLFVIGHEERDRLAGMLAEMGIGTLVHYDPLPHLTPAYNDLGWRPGAFPVAERLASQALSLPLSPQLSDLEAERVISALLTVVGHSAG